MVYVTSDTHGWPLEKFLQLLDNAGFGDDDFLFVLGDVIDRNGDGGVAFLRWLTLQPNAQLILGNHEDMLLNAAFIFEEITDARIEKLSAAEIDAYNLWMFNGAAPTIASLRRLHRRDPEAVSDLLDYLREAPLYEGLSLDSGDFLLVHSGLGSFHPDKAMEDYSRKDLLWSRPAANECYYKNGPTVILGHTPAVRFGAAPARPYKTDGWMCIDTGAGSGGTPMLLRLDDMAEFYAE